MPTKSFKPEHRDLSLSLNAAAVATTGQPIEIKQIQLEGGVSYSTARRIANGKWNRDFKVIARLARSPIFGQGVIDALGRCDEISTDFDGDGDTDRDDEGLVLVSALRDLAAEIESHAKTTRALTHEEATARRARSRRIRCKLEAFERMTEQNAMRPQMQIASQRTA